MQDDLAVIRRARREHEDIRSAIRLLEEHTSSLDDEYYRAAWISRQIGSQEQSPEGVFTDRDAIYRLSLASDQFSPVDLREEVSNEMAGNLEVIADGLERHFTYEETVVADVFRRRGGGILVVPMLAPHGPIRQALADLLDMARSKVWQGKDSEAQAALGRTFSNNLQRLLSSIEEHAQREEVVFELVEEALESEH